MSHHHLKLEERYVIYHLVLYGLSYREIGRRLGRHHTTIMREVDRNGPSHDGVYYHETAHRHARTRFAKARHRRRFEHRPLRDRVFAGLHRDWSPEQIAGRLKWDHPKNKRMRIAPETIYQWIYTEACSGGELYHHLRRRHKKRRRQRRYGSGRGLIPGRVSIRERPAAVESRRRFGDWEGDLVEGRKSTGAIATLVERKSRYLLAKGLASKHARPTAAAITGLLAALPSKGRRTLTLDNGKEFARFKMIEEGTGAKVYFADPYAAWQRGSNENTNGLIRQYLPKGIDMRNTSEQKLAIIVHNINHRPRKCLGYKTPFEVLSRQFAGAIAI